MTDHIEQLLLLKGLEKKAIETISKLVTHVSCKKGTSLFKEGVISDGLYLVSKGALSIHSGGQHLGTVSAGKSVGEMGAITGQPRSADVIAAEDSELLFLSKIKLDDLITKHPAWGLKIYQNVIIYLSSNLKEKNFIFEAERLLEDIEVSLDND